MKKQQNRFIPTSGTLLDLIKVSDLEEISDQDTDSDVVECEEYGGHQGTAAKMAVYNATYVVAYHN